MEVLSAGGQGGGAGKPREPAVMVLADIDVTLTRVALIAVSVAATVETVALVVLVRWLKRAGTPIVTLLDDLVRRGGER